MRSNDVPAHVQSSAERVLDAAFAVHTALGPGCLEGVYRRALVIALEHRGASVTEEVSLDMVFEGVVVPRVLRMDLVVDDMIVVEIKAVENVLPVHLAQLVSYLRMSGLPLGYLLNFHEPRLKFGTHRRVNTRPPTIPS